MSVLVYVVGAVLRLLSWYLSLADMIADGVMFSTPLTDWQRVLEGSYMISRGVSPYDGDTVHEPAPTLYLLHHTLSLGSWAAPVLFIIVDLLNAHLLSLAASAFLHNQVNELQAIVSGSVSDTDAVSRRTAAAALPERRHQLVWAPPLTAAVYLCCPLAVLPCGALSTAILHVLPLTAALHAAMKAELTASTARVDGLWTWCACCVGVSAFLNIYTATMVAPLAVAAASSRRSRGAGFLAAFVVTAAIMAHLSRWLAGDWRFLSATFGFTFCVADLTPNIGLFWYFFIEMFEHFEWLFVATFQINAFIYTLPLTLRFGRQLFVCLLSLLVLCSTFSSYPTTVLAAIYLSLAVCMWHTRTHTRYTLPLLCCVLSVAVLAPLTWQLWLHAGSANANFFFAITLVYNAAQIFFVTDIVFAVCKYNYELGHGNMAGQLDSQQKSRLVLM